jgi:hypothetical protein
MSLRKFNETAANIMATIVADNAARAAILAFFTVLLGQVLLIFFFGVDVPQGDQWDGEFYWYKAMLSNNASWSALIAPHNEHRIAATRIFNSAIFLLIGGWRPIVVMYAQSILISGFVAWLCILLSKYAGRWRTLGLTFTIVAFLSPYSWQNTLGAFQNQFYFMLLFAFLTIGLLAWSSSWSAILAAFAFAALSPFTTAGGILTIVVFLFMTGINFVSKRLSPLKFAVLLALILPIAVWQFTNLHHVVGHDALKARSVTEFVVSLLKVLSWPEAPLGLALWGIIAYGIFRKYCNLGEVLPWFSEISSIQIFVVGALLWLSLQLAATAYSRTHSDLMAARYQQTYSLIIPLFFLSLNVMAVNIKWLHPLLVASLLVVGLVSRNGREWPYMTKGVAELRFAKTEITKAMEMESFTYLKAIEKGEFSLGYSSADAVWQRIHDENLFTYHLWLKRGKQP